MKIIHLLELGDPDIKPVVRHLADDADPLVALKGRMLLGLVYHLENGGPAPCVFGYLSGDELWLTPANRHNRARVHIRADWRDYGPARDGIPEMHYRLSIRRPGSPLRRDERASELSD